MNKELEALEDIILYLNANEPKGLYCENIETIQQALQRLEAIDSTTSSEALECLEYLYSVPDDYRNNDRARDYETIKNYILKTQE